MKWVKTVLAIGIVAAAVVGCSTTNSPKTTEEMLTAAGFKVAPANTPRQVAHLKSLKPRTFTVTTRDGTQYWTYPDVHDNVLYVGQQAQYDAYQKLRLQKQIADENMAAAQAAADPMSDDWGAWGQW